MKKQVFQQPNIEIDSVDILSNKLITLTNELLKSNQKLEQIQLEKNEMFSNLSHDLRAPISAIRSAVDLLLSEHTLSQDDIHAAVSLIDRRTTTLETLIQNMYLLFTLENKEQPLHYETVSAAEFLEEYFYNAIVDHRYDDKNMHLDVPECMDIQISIDLQQMVRVLDNLFTNAAKYSPANADITLSVSLNHNSTFLIIKVIDTGIGIPAESLNKIFDRTYTVSSARTPDSPTGSGLGLCIVKRIVEMHHGKINCKSKPGKGSTFTIRLPIVPSISHHIFTNSSYPSISR